MVVCRRLALYCLIILSKLTVLGDIVGNYSLSGDETFTSTAGSTFQIGTGSTTTFNVQSYTATLTGSGDFLVNSQIKGAGSGTVIIDLTDPNGTVTYNANNGFSGLTWVKSGTLDLVRVGNNKAISGDLTIGGGPNLAIVTRETTANNSLIVNTKTVTLNANGTFKLNREPTGSTTANASTEGIGTLVLNGGTLLNASPNTLPTLFTSSKITLSADSTIALGTATTLSLGNVTAWNSGAVLTFTGWNLSSPDDSILFGSTLSATELSQIRFQFADGGTRGGWQSTFDGKIRPVPEANSIVAFAFLSGAVVLLEVKRRRKKHEAAR
jgi:hypothetical protein